jgi:hypothetical protein
MIARMLCSTAGLTRGDLITVTAVNEPFATVTAPDGSQQLVLTGDYAEEVAA